MALKPSGIHTYEDFTMTHLANSKSYTFKDGLASMAAKAVGIDPELAVAAGEGARRSQRHPKGRQGPQPRRPRQLRA